MPQAKNYLEFAAGFAEANGEAIVAAFNNDDIVPYVKPDGTRATNIDDSINDNFIHDLERIDAWRSHEVVGEERSRASSVDSRHRWIIDPLDGTHRVLDVLAKKNACQSFSYEELSCGIAIAKEYDGMLEAAVFYNPFKRELFLAAAGLGATLNGNIIRTKIQSPHIENYDYCYWPGAEPDARAMKEIFGHPPAGSGSAIYQACEVACGRSAFSIFPGRSEKTLHDVAAGILIAKESGAVVSDFSGNPHDLRGVWHGAVYSSDIETHERVLDTLAAW
jgi:myo-inositol-1(or 4)-monophosphatase